MKLTNLLVALLAGALAATSLAAVAQNQNRQGDRAEQQVRERQVERAAERDRAMEHERLQTRDRDRVREQDALATGQGDQDRLRTRDQEKAQDQVRDRDRIHQADASSATAGDVYGQALMTEQERNRYRERLMNAGTEEERQQIQARHREEMNRRAREQGVEIAEPEGE